MAGEMADIDAFLARTEDALARGRTRRLAEGLAAVDRLLLARLWGAQRAGRCAEAEALAGYARYRRGIFLRAARAAGRGRRELLELFSGVGTGRLVLLVTRLCQLRCSYCRVRKYPARMSMAVADAAVRFALTAGRPEVELQFFGGEPLLAFDVVRRAVAQAEALAARLGKRVRFLLTTNGLALDRETLSFLSAHAFCVEFSCDGSPQTQRDQRAALGGRDYSRALSRSLAALKHAGLPYHVIAVVPPERAGSIEETFRYLAGLGHRRIQLNYALGRVWSREAQDRFARGLAGAGRLARRLGVVLVNETRQRREPVALNGEITVDCDGGVYRGLAHGLEEDFMAMKSRFLVADVLRAGPFDYYGASQFDNFWLLAQTFAGNPDMRRTLLNNIGFGFRLAGEAAA